MAGPVKERRSYNSTLRQEQARLTRQRIVEAGRRLLAKGTYSAVTMEEIAVEAGVSYQTVYAVFGNKLRVAARVARRVLEVCADLPRFMRESGDPTLRARYQQMEDQRYADYQELSDMLERSGRLRKGLSAEEARSVLWGLTGADWYCLLVFQRRWKPARYEEWLAQALIDLVLEPRP